MLSLTHYQVHQIAGNSAMHRSLRLGLRRLCLAANASRETAGGDAVIPASAGAVRFSSHARTSSTSSASECNTQHASEQHAMTNYMRTKRRLAASPTLPLEALALTDSVHRAVENMLREAKVNPDDVRRATFATDRLRASESLINRLKARTSYEGTAKALDYAIGTTALSCGVMSLPVSLSSNTYVMAEARRCLPNFKPSSMLDFGSGSAPAVSAAARVFRDRDESCVSNSSESSSDLNGVLNNQRSTEYLRDNSWTSESSGNRSCVDAANGVFSAVRTGEARGRSKQDWTPSGCVHLQRVCLVDHEPNMLNLGLKLLRADPYVTDASKDSECSRSVKIKGFESLRRLPSQLGDTQKFSIVTASYSLSELAQKGMADGADDGNTLSMSDRTRLAERRIRKVVRQLWRRVERGGLLIIVESGTLSGFETVLFARDLILREGEMKEDSETLLGAVDNADMYQDSSNASNAGDYIANDLGGGSSDFAATATSGSYPSTVAKVIAPCLHSKQCPLQGSTDRFRICRFVQRFNRPRFLRLAKPTRDGFEDEYFSYSVLQKVDKDVEKTEPASESDDALEKAGADCGSDKSVKNLTTAYWGRLIQKPRVKHKHVILDCCTAEGVLERRVASKSNESSERFRLARKVLWGDLWPRPPPPTSPQDVHF